MLPYHAQAAQLAAGFGGSVRGGRIGLAGHRTGPSSGGDRAQRRRMMLRFRCFEAILQGSAAVAPRFPLLSAIIELRTPGAKPRLRDAVRRAAMRGDEAAAPPPV